MTYLQGYNIHKKPARLRSLDGRFLYLSNAELTNYGYMISLLAQIVNYLIKITSLLLI